MDFRITLRTNGADRTIDPSELKNWADVMRSLKRSDYGGVVRSFTSKFEFTGKAYAYLQSLYLTSGVETKCELKISLPNDNWEYVEHYTCPLDLSTLTWDGHILSVSAVDNTLAAIIKAGKGTKYEFAVGDDIIPDGKFRFDRIPMNETATYEFTQGNSDDKGAITVEMAMDELPWLGCVNNEAAIGGVVLYKDDQNPDDGGCLLVAHKATSVRLEWMIDVDRRVADGCNVSFAIDVMTGADVVSSHAIEMNDRVVILGGSAPVGLGEFPNVAALPATTALGNWATVNGVLYVFEHKGSNMWVDKSVTPDEYFHDVYSGRMLITLNAGQRIRMSASYMPGSDFTKFKLNSSKFAFALLARGEKCDIPMFTPVTVAETVLRKMAGGNFDSTITVDISDHDDRMSHTRMLAGECIRGLEQAKLYTSFDEFCDWMETVFGYVYYICEPHRDNTGYKRVGEIIYTPYSLTTSTYHGTIDPAYIVYFPNHGMFAYHADDRYYMSFDGYEDYMTNYSRPLPGVLYKFRQGLYYFNQNDDESMDPTPQPYPYDVTKDIVTVHFVHRSELFSGEIGKTITNANDVNYNINASQIYSTVEIGYDKKDYDSVNGRDEFNFTHTYTTGSVVSSKKLSLISKYRADCYGIEFAAQKRSQANTDSKADQDVFFVYCQFLRNDLATVGGSAPAGCLNSFAFNSEYNPRNCAVANAGYIGMQGNGLVLKFASSTGNSDVISYGVPINSDIDLGTPLLTVGEIDFTTNDQMLPDNPNEAISVTSGGIEYVGYVSDVDVNLLRPEAAKYKLLVKSATPI